jgi:hypothetical protein
MESGAGYVSALGPAQTCCDLSHRMPPIFRPTRTPGLLVEPIGSSYPPRRQSEPQVPLSSSENVKVLAGGTTLVDLMKNGVERPQRLIDTTGIRELHEFAIDGEELRFGALVRMSEMAGHAEIYRGQEKPLSIGPFHR